MLSLCIGTHHTHLFFPKNYFSLPCMFNTKMVTQMMSLWLKTYKTKNINDDIKNIAYLRKKSVYCFIGVVKKDRENECLCFENV